MAGAAGPPPTPLPPPPLPLLLLLLLALRSRLLFLLPLLSSKSSRRSLRRLPARATWERLCA